MDVCWNQPQRNTVRSVIFRQEASSAGCYTSSCVKRRKVPVFWGALGGCNWLLLPVGVQWDQAGQSSDQADVILVGASPSSQSCGLVHVWGGGWEGRLTATPPCPPAPHRSRSPGTGSKGQAQESVVSSSRKWHMLCGRQIRVKLRRYRRGQQNWQSSKNMFLMTAVLPSYVWTWLFSILTPLPVFLFTRSCSARWWLIGQLALCSHLVAQTVKLFHCLKAITEDCSISVLKLGYFVFLEWTCCLWIDFLFLFVVNVQCAYIWPL